MRKKIEEAYLSVLSQTGRELNVLKLEDSTVILESGLDSLGFAILVSVLEEEVGIDPFSLMDNPEYPKTFGEMVSLYEKYSN